MLGLFLALAPVGLALAPVGTVPDKAELAGIELVYELHAADAEEREATLAVLERRLDGTDATLGHDADGRLTVALPRSAFLTEARLASALSATAPALALEPLAAEAFPAAGGLVCVGDELVRYGRREGPMLLRLERAALGTRASAHAAGAVVSHPELRVLRRRVEARGALAFRIQAKKDDYARLGTTSGRERERLKAWLAEHAPPGSESPGELARFNRLARDAGGPAPGLTWHRLRRTDPADDPPPVALVAPEDPAWRFGTEDLDTVSLSQDTLGWPAVAFELRADRRQAFGDFTEAHVGDTLAVLVDGEVVTKAPIKTRLPSGGIIEGGGNGFEPQEAATLIAILGGGELPVTPELVTVRPR